MALKNEYSKTDLEILESVEFDALLAAAELVTKTHGNINNINQTTSDLKKMMAGENFSRVARQNNPFITVVESVEKLIWDIGEKKYAD